MEVMDILAMMCIWAVCWMGNPNYAGSGIATHYGSWHHGKTMANGEPFDMYAHTCAHRWIPLGTRIDIEVKKGKHKGKRSWCIVTDRGPYGAYLHDGTRVQRMHKMGGVWKVKHFNGVWEEFESKPGRYRGLIDMSLGTARDLQGIEEGKPDNFVVRIWRYE